jgi:hypothetical protein
VSDDLIFSMAQQPNWGLDRLVVEVSRLHTIRHAQPVGLIQTSDQFVSKAVSGTTHNTHEKSRSMPSAGFAPATPQNQAALDLRLIPQGHQDWLTIILTKTVVIFPLLGLF